MSVCQSGIETVVGMGSPLTFVAVCHRIQHPGDRGGILYGCQLEQIAVVGFIAQDTGGAAPRLISDVVCVDSFIDCIAYKKISIIVFLFRTHEEVVCKLQELIQADQRKTVTYDLLSSSGPSNNPVFEMAVKMDDMILGVGTGSSKKRAEQKAAKDALNKLAR